jgi:segregation and condensation protein A
MNERPADEMLELESESAYRVRLPRFEGPLDLLLYLIQKNEIDIYDIPIARITHEYLEYLELMKLLDLELAGEFLVMAATLIRIKARMLMPREEIEEGEEEGPDPREELQRMLLEHQHFSHLGGELGEMAEREKRIFARPGETGEEPEPDWREATIFDLLASFRKMMARAPQRTGYRVEREEVTIEEMMEEIRERLENREPVLFWKLARPDAVRGELVVLFLAILELTRLGRLRLRQAAAFGELWVSWREAPQEGSPPVEETAPPRADEMGEGDGS